MDETSGDPALRCDPVPVPLGEGEFCERSCKSSPKGICSTGLLRSLPLSPVVGDRREKVNDRSVGDERLERLLGEGANG